MEQTIVEKLYQLRQEGDSIRKHSGGFAYEITYIDKGEFNAWRNKILIYFNKLQIVPPEIINSIKSSRNNYLSDIKAVQSQIDVLISLINDNTITPINTTSQNESPNTILENIFLKFHVIATQLQKRHEQRQTIKIDDEYDVQDLLHALLLLYFEDVRDEENVPSFAGSNGRTDFLLKKEKIFIEVKKTRKNLADRKLGEELVVDIGKYKQHQDCEFLYFFIYDPESIIKNPVGLKKDIEKDYPDFVKVIISPER